MNNKARTGGGTSITDRLRFSLVFKLNIRTLIRLFSAFLAVNVLLVILLSGTSLWKAETGMQELFKNPEIISGVEEETPFSVPEYSIKIIEDAGGGIILPSFMQKLLPVAVPDAGRSFALTRPYSNSFFSKIESIEYHVALSVGDTTYLAAYAMGKDIKFYLYILIAVAVFELLILTGNISEGNRSIRKILNPLSEMAEKARNLNDEVAGMHLKDLAGAISDIDANRLDRRIPVHGSQNELKDLAGAINNMLNRISDSYNSQIRFVSDASHELRTPISVIQGYVNLLDRWGKDDEKTMEEAIEAIKTESENMKELVEKLLFLARGDSHTMQLQKTVFDLCEIVDEIIRETDMIDPDHVLETDMDRPLYINADQQLLKQAVRILMDNSIKYTPPGEKILLKASGNNGFIRIMVQDNGIGIDPEDLANIFNRFYRSDESRARKTGGSGLGLAIAHWIVERHGGHFEVLSRVDIGTRTTIVIPAGDTRIQKEA